MLIIILCVAIFTFSSLGAVREGYKNHKRHYCHRCQMEHDEQTDCPYGDKDADTDMDSKSTSTSTGTGTGTDTGSNSLLDNMNGSYIAPAGNTVLFGIDMDESMPAKQKKHKQRKAPQGIPGSQIPEGDEHLYILKSEIVPPVCPACPNVTVCPNNNSKPPPCPPCARCPEPSFECKKVPNYSSNTTDYLPRPILTDFSQFGM